MSNDTIFALSSGALPAAIAIVRVSGPSAEHAAAALAGPLPEPRVASLRRLKAHDGGLIDEALVLRFPAPHTATGEPLVEFHLHGGRAVVARLLAELATDPDLREAEPGEFTRRAMLNGRIDLTQAEGLADLLNAETEWQRRAAVETAGGALRKQVDDWRRRLIDLSAQAEAAIDYVGDEDETAIDATKLARQAETIREEWVQVLAQPPAELLSSGLRVVLAGPPNSGKSSLFNALIGSERAIVTPIAGTTRDMIEARLDLEGIPLTLVDTAGLRDATDAVEQIGVDRAKSAMVDADIILWLGDPAVAPAHGAVILVHSRADERGAAPCGSLASSVHDSASLSLLQAAIAEHSRNLLPPPEQAALNRRQRGSLHHAAVALEAARTWDILLVADGLRQAIRQLDVLTGHSSTDDMLDVLFGRFCLGK